MTAATELEQVNLATAEDNDAPTAHVYTGSRREIELLRDLLLDEYTEQTGLTLDDVDPSELGGAMQAALRRFATRPLEPGNWSARVVAVRRRPEPAHLTYAKVDGIWVSPADTTGREWTDLVVEYDELEVLHDDTPIGFIPADPPVVQP